MSHELFTLHWSFGLDPQTDTYTTMEDALQRAQDLRRGGAGTPERILDDHGDIILSEEELYELLEEEELRDNSMAMTE